MLTKEAVIVIFTLLPTVTVQLRSPAWSHSHRHTVLCGGRRWYVSLNHSFKTSFNYIILLRTRSTRHQFFSNLVWKFISRLLKLVNDILCTIIVSYHWNFWKFISGLLSWLSVWLFSHRKCVIFWFIVKLKLAERCMWPFNICTGKWKNPLALSQ